MILKMEKTKLFSFKEHEIISDGSLNDCLEIIYNDYDPNNPNKYLGLNCCNHKNKTFQTNYYIGIDWIVEGESAIMVEPKIKGLNYLKMFMDCFDCDNIIAKEKLKDIYHIDFGRDPIKVKNNTFELTPLLIIHFIKLMQSLTKRNLKKDYIQVEENFNSKIKGKILFSKNVKYNVFKGREDRFYCKYQDYSSDCIENRILKKTLRYVQKYLDNNSISIKHEELDVICNSCLAVFEHVSDDLTIQQIKQFKVNPLFKEYAESLKVAKLILRRFSYSIDNATSEIDRNLPPFWIDMPLLFEVYVLTLLQKEYGKEIDYHVSTYGNETDFIKYDEKMILDTKYNIKWQDYVFHENVRQLSGYARNISLRRKIMIKEYDDSTILPCLIIYPNKNGLEKGDILSQKEEIKEYIKFYKAGIKLPLK